MIKLYGIKNCDTVKKACRYLEERNQEYEFVDFKKTKLNKENIETWKKSFGDWPVNKKGRTYRQLKDEFENSTDLEKVNLIIENTSLIKRPILEIKNKTVAFGFEKETYQKTLT